MPHLHYGPFSHYASCFTPACLTCVAVDHPHAFPTATHSLPCLSIHESRNLVDRSHTLCGWHLHFDYFKTSNFHGSVSHRFLDDCRATDRLPQAGILISCSQRLQSVPRGRNGKARLATVTIIKRFHPALSSFLLDFSKFHQISRHSRSFCSC